MKPIPYQNFDFNFKLLHHQRVCGTAGNVLIYVVVLMLIFGTLGVAMVSLFSTSVASTATSNDTRRARYLSEAGVRYTIGELRDQDFDEDYIIDPLHTLTYTVAGAGTFEPNVFTPWFESDADVDTPDVISVSPRLGEIPPDFITDPASPLDDVWLVNYEYITGAGPDITTMRDEVNSYTINGTSLDVDISADFVANIGERVSLAVEPTVNQTINEGGDLYVARDARFFFPPFNGAININRIDYAYARLVDDDDNSRVILENVTASQFPPPPPGLPNPFPLTVEADSGGTYDGDFVILSPRNYTVMAEGTSDAVSLGNEYALGMNIYDDSLVQPDDRADITAEDFVTNLSEQETDTRFFEPNLVDYKLVIGGGVGNRFGSAFYNATRNIGGQRDYCNAGACLFYLGVRVFFLLDFTSQGDGITFTLLNGANNRASSAGGDVELSELMGYAGDSRTNSAGTTYLATAPEDRGLDPPKIAVEFDTIANNDTLAYCADSSSVNEETRDDPLVGNQDAVQYVFWASESLDLSCRSGADNSTYDDNRHGPGFWQFDTARKVKSSAAVDPGDGTIYIGSNDNKLYAINPDGTPKWDFTTGGDVISSPALASDGTIYVGSNDNKVYAINSNGTLKWEFLTLGDVRSSPAVASDGTIYIGSDDGNMYALVDGGQGNVSQKLGWPFNTGAAFSLGRPAIGSDGTIYFSAQSNLYARNPDGSEKWNRNFGVGDGAIIDYMPGVDTVAGFGFVYTDVPGNAIAALNPANGNEVWRVSVNADIDSTPVVGPDGTIYFGTDDNDNNQGLFAVTPGALSGSIKWEFPTGGDVDNIPALSPDGSAVYAVSKDGNLYSVDTAIGPDPGTGEPLWSFEIVTDTADSPANVTSSPVVDPNTGFIYVGSDDNSVYALTPFDEEPLNLRKPDDKVLTFDDLSGTVDSATNWLSGAGSRGPWAVRLEVDRCPSKIIDAAGECVPDADGKYDYELRLWMKQCINEDCDNIMTADEPFPIDDPFFKDTRIEYQLTLPPNLVQSFKLDATEFNDFFFGFTAAAEAGEAQEVTVANFALSFIRLGDSVIDLPEF